VRFERASSLELTASIMDVSHSRVQRFKEEHRELKARFEQQKRQSEDAARSDLLGTSASGNSSSIGTGFAHRTSAGTSARQRANAPSTPLMESPFSLPNTTNAGAGPGSREDFALREHTFLQETEASLDQYIAQGRAVLGDLVEQGTTLRGAKKKVLKAAETLGLSRQVIGWVDKRR
jgi:Golgi SNAP receptor complex protein 2